MAHYSKLAQLDGCINGLDTREEREAFLNFFIGALSGSVTPAEWDTALTTATRLMERTAEPLCRCGRPASDTKAHPKGGYITGLPGHTFDDGHDADPEPEPDGDDLSEINALRAERGHRAL